MLVAGGALGELGGGPFFHELKWGHLYGLCGKILGDSRIAVK
jgi:hypothetical protein